MAMLGGLTLKNWRSHRGCLCWCVCQWNRRCCRGCLCQGVCHWNWRCHRGCLCWGLWHDLEYVDSMKHFIDCAKHLINTDGEFSIKYVDSCGAFDWLWPGIENSMSALVKHLLKVEEAILVEHFSAGAHIIQPCQVKYEMAWNICFEETSNILSRNQHTVSMKGPAGSHDKSS